MIRYPKDEEVQREATKHDIAPDVLIRDLVRIVEVLNLQSQNFFDKNNVLAGSMALRSYKSPRFTVYDADFSLAAEAQNQTHKIKEQLAYRDDELTIRPTTLTPYDIPGSMWQSEPVSYDPVFTDLAPNDRQFKADFAFRGLVRDGIERPLLLPYDLEIWDEAPLLWLMDPHEVVAEKVLGWCLNRLVKHYADLGFIAIASKGSELRLSSPTLRTALGDKLSVIKQLQPQKYAAFETIDDLIDCLDRDPNLSQDQWLKLVYLDAHRKTFYNQATLEKAVRRRLVPLLRGDIDS